MKFFNILALVTFASAAPTLVQVQPAIEARDVSAALEARQAQGNDGFGGAISAAVAELRSVTTTNLNAIRTALEQSRGAVSAEVLVQVQGAIRANFAQIAEALRTAGAAITAATTGSGANFQNIIAGLTTGQVNNIRAAITDATAIVQLIGTTLSGSITGVQPVVRQLVIDELAALRIAFNAFIGPLQTFIQATQNAGNGAQVGLTGLAGVVQSLGSVVQNLVSGLGLPNLNIGGNAPSVPSTGGGLPGLPNLGNGLNLGGVVGGATGGATGAGQGLIPSVLGLLGGVRGGRPN